MQQMGINRYIPFLIPLLIPHFMLSFWITLWLMASKQQTTALFLSTIATRTRRHTETDRKTDKPDVKSVLWQRTFRSVFFFVQFSVHIKTN
jgi:hypothetical protein